jgi:hypothetical protein
LACSDYLKPSAHKRSRLFQIARVYDWKNEALRDLDDFSKSSRKIVLRGANRFTTNLLLALNAIPAVQAGTPLRTHAHNFMPGNRRKSDDIEYVVQNINVAEAK